MPEIELHVRGGIRRISYKLSKARDNTALPVQRAGFTHVVFLHHATGMSGSWEKIENLMQAALPHASLLSYDRLGFGKSQPLQKWSADYHDDGVQELLGLLDAIGIAEAVLVGHSDGATIALMAAALAPERVAAVIAEAPHVWHGQRYGGDGGFGEFHRTLRPDPRFQKAMRRDHGDGWEVVYNRWRTWWTAPENFGWDVSHVLPKVTCPTLCFHGASDEFFPEEHTKLISDAVKSGAMKVLPAGHMIHTDEPRAFADATIQLIQSLYGSESTGHSSPIAAPSQSKL